MAQTDPPLPIRMRVAADVLEDANQRIGTNQNSVWSPESLRYSAKIWEQEDAEDDQRKNQIIELATLLRNGVAPSRPMWQQATLGDWTAIAHALIDQGWKKESTDGTNG